MQLLTPFFLIHLLLVGQNDASGNGATEAALGYHVSVPHGWQRIPMALIGELAPDARAAVAEIPIDKDCVELLISPGKHATGIAVCQVIAKALPPWKSLAEWERTRWHGNPPDWFQIRDERDGLPVEVRGVTGGWRQIDGRRMHVTDVTGSRRPIGASLKCRQAGWYAGSKIVYLVAAAKAEQFDHFAEEFDAIIASVRIDPWWKAMLTMHNAIVVAAALVLLIALVQIRRRRSRRRDVKFGQPPIPANR